MKVTELLGALDEDQEFDIRTKEGELIDYQTAAKYDAKVLGIRAIKDCIIIESNFTWYC